MGRNCSVSSLVSHLNCLKCLRNRTDLIQLNQDRVSASKRNTLGKSLRIGYKQVIANQLNLVAKFFGKLLPAFPVFLIQGILDGNDRVFVNQLFPVVDQLIRCINSTSLWKLVLAKLACLPLRRSSVHSDHKVFSWLIACILNSLENGLNGLFVRF